MQWTLHHSRADTLGCQCPCNAHKCLPVFVWFGRCVMIPHMPPSCFSLFTVHLGTCLSTSARRWLETMVRAMPTTPPSTTDVVTTPLTKSSMLPRVFVQHIWLLQTTDERVGVVFTIVVDTATKNGEYNVVCQYTSCWWIITRRCPGQAFAATHTSPAAVPSASPASTVIHD